MERILVIDDHADARREMRSVVMQAFKGSSVSSAATLAQARELLTTQSFDLVILDLDLPDGRGEDFLAELLSKRPNLYVVISTIHDESDRLLAALQAGAKGYLLKEQMTEQLVAEFQGIRRGKPALAPAVARRMLEFLRTGRPSQPVAQSVLAMQAQKPLPQSDAEADLHAPLTHREEEILVLMSKGFNRPEIGGILGISKHTVATHVDKVYRKLGVSTRSEAAAIAHKRNLL